MDDLRLNAPVLLVEKNFERSICDNTRGSYQIFYNANSLSQKFMNFIRFVKKSKLNIAYHVVFWISLF